MWIMYTFRQTKRRLDVYILLAVLFGDVSEIVTKPVKIHRAEAYSLRFVFWLY